VLNEGPTETIDPRREIGPGSVQRRIVIFADVLVTKRLIRFGLDAGRQFLVVRQCPTGQGCYSFARHRRDRRTMPLDFASVRITSAAGNSRRKMSNISSGGVALGGPNQDLASSFALLSFDAESPASEAPSLTNRRWMGFPRSSCRKCSIHRRVQQSPG
jgi:hypothetical protein